MKWKCVHGDRKAISMLSQVEEEFWVYFYSTIISMNRMLKDLERESLPLRLHRVGFKCRLQYLMVMWSRSGYTLWGWQSRSMSSSLYSFSIVSLMSKVLCLILRDPSIFLFEKKKCYKLSNEDDRLNRHGENAR